MLGVGGVGQDDARVWKQLVLARVTLALERIATRLFLFDQLTEWHWLPLRQLVYELSARCHRLKPGVQVVGLDATAFVVLRPKSQGVRTDT